MNIPEGFTPRGDSNEQPLETYDKDVLLWKANHPLGYTVTTAKANTADWKIPEGSMRILAFQVLS